MNQIINKYVRKSFPSSIFSTATYKSIPKIFNKYLVVVQENGIYESRGRDKRTRVKVSAVLVSGEG